MPPKQAKRNPSGYKATGNDVGGTKDTVKAIKLEHDSTVDLHDADPGPPASLDGNGTESNPDIVDKQQDNGSATEQGLLAKLSLLMPSSELVAILLFSCLASIIIWVLLYPVLHYISKWWMGFLAAHMGDPNEWSPGGEYRHRARVPRPDGN